MPQWNNIFISIFNVILYDICIFYPFYLLLLFSLASNIKSKILNPEIRLFR
mgnify:CR=1 FL=1